MVGETQKKEYLTRWLEGQSRLHRGLLVVYDNSTSAMKFWYRLSHSSVPLSIYFTDLWPAAVYPTSAHRGAKQINWKIWISLHLARLTLRLSSSFSSSCLQFFWPFFTRPLATSSSYTFSSLRRIWRKSKNTITGLFIATYLCWFESSTLPWAERIVFII